MNLKRYVWEKNRLNYALVVLFAFFNAMCGVFTAEVLRQFTNVLFAAEKNQLIRVMAELCMEGITVISICHHRIAGIHDKYDAVICLSGGRAQEGDAME